VVRAGTEPTRLLVYCHGNGEHVADQANLVFSPASRLNATVLFTIIAATAAAGQTAERGCIADGLAAQRWLAEREGVETTDIVVAGRSIGGGVAGPWPPSKAPGPDSGKHFFRMTVPRLPCTPGCRCESS